MIKRKRRSFSRNSGDQKGASQKPREEQLETLLRDVDAVQRRIRRLNAEEKNETRRIEKRYCNLRKPIYQRRTDLIATIPHFWISIFVNHPRISRCLTKGDEEALQHLSNIEVSDPDDDENGYKISFHFSKNKFFSNEVLTKEVYVDKDGTRKCLVTEIDWFPKKCLTSKSMQAARTFFSWLCESSVGRLDSLDKVIRDELWPNPLVSNFQPIDTEEDINGPRISFLKAVQAVCQGTSEPKSAQIDSSSFDDCVTRVTSTENAICFLISRNILSRSGPPCHKCQGPLELRLSSRSPDGIAFRCRRDKTQVSLRVDSFIHNSGLRAEQFLVLAFYWAFHHAICSAAHKTQISQAAVFNWFSKFREVCVWYLNMHPRVLGGPGRIVELDLRQLVPRRLRNGEYLQPTWILIGVDQITELSFLEIVDDRSREALVLLIEQYIAPGTVLHTDKGFGVLRRLSMDPPIVWNVIRRTKKMKKTVVLESVEKIWKNLHFDGMNIVQKSTLVEHFYEFMWRQEFGRTDQDAFDNLLLHISTWYFTP